MGAESSIQWTDATWNPVRGCTVVSPGCANCYAMGVAARFSGDGQPYEGLARFSTQRRLPQWTGVARLVPEHLADPLRWRRPRRIFVNSMSDLFHESLTNEEIAAVFGIMAAAPQHVFQVLTKRAKRMREWFEWVSKRETGLFTERWSPRFFCFASAAEAVGGRSDGWRIGTTGLGPWPLPNVWLGVSAEDQERADERIPDLLATPAAVRFVSAEPLLGPIDFEQLRGGELLDAEGADFVNALRGSTYWANGDHGANVNGLDWVIVGGESGPRARPFDLDWARSIVDQCVAAGVPVFVKQMGARPYQSVSAASRGMGGIGLGLRSRKGDDPAEWPPELRVREFPR